MSRFSWVNDWS